VPPNRIKSVKTAAPAPIIVRRIYQPDVERQIAALLLVLGLASPPLPPRPPARAPRPEKAA
jgi:hypothetical protein